MKIEIDQSGRIEYTAHMTVIGDSLGNCVLIKATEKRILQDIYRSSRRPRMFMFETFSVLTAKLISQTHNATTQYIIDNEYDGWTKLIKEQILMYAYFYNCNIEKSTVLFKAIGKSSLAHKTVNKRFSQKTKGGVWVSAREVLAITRIKKKTGVLR